MREAAAATLWLGAGLGKMAALASLIDGVWQQALLCLLVAWSLAAVALWLQRRQPA